MELMEAITSRRAVRDYTAEAVAEAQLRSLVDAAVKAPSAMNGQPWAFRIVRDRALMTRISVASKAQMLRTTMAGAVAHHLQEMLSNDAFHIFYNAPALIVIAATEDSHWAVVDCALAAENLMLAACDAGLGSCWIGFAEAWLGTAEGKSALDIPASYRPIAPIIVGHPTLATIPSVARRDPEIGWIG
jgi:nitroreductase